MVAKSSGYRDRRSHLGADDLWNQRMCNWRHRLKRITKSIFDSVWFAIVLFFVMAIILYRVLLYGKPTYPGSGESSSLLNVKKS